MSLPASSALPNLTGIPGGINESIPLQVRTPEPIDLLGQQSRAYTLASQVGAVQDEQQLRADRQSITDYLQQGGELETPDGVDAAIRTLKGKLSVPTYQKLLAGKDQAYNRVLEAAKSKANLTSTEIDQQEKQFSLLGMGLQRAEIQRKAAVDAALASGLDQTAANNQALEAFNSSKQAYAETMRASKVPDTVIDEFLAIPPAQVPNVIGATKFGQAALKAASEAQFKSAEAYRNIAQLKDYEAKSKVDERIASGAIMPKAETFVDATGKSYLVDRTTQSALVSTDSGQMVSIPWADVPWKSLSKVGSANTPAGAISDETIDYYARQSLAGDNSWQIGLALCKVGQALIAAVKDRNTELAKVSQIAPEDDSTTKDESLSL